MPYVPRKRRRQRDGWGQTDTLVLQVGCDVLGFGTTFSSLDDPRAAECWHEKRIEVLDETIREFPGTRPRAWWRFEGLGTFGPRRRVEGSAIADPDRPDESMDVPYPHDGYESEEVYLRRHGVLESSELFALARRREASKPKTKKRTDEE